MLLPIANWRLPIDTIPGCSLPTHQTHYAHIMLTVASNQSALGNRQSAMPKA
jgi:hypothetical protein